MSWQDPVYPSEALRLFFELQTESSPYDLGVHTLQSCTRLPWGVILTSRNSRVHIYQRPWWPLMHRQQFYHSPCHWLQFTYFSMGRNWKTPQKTDGIENFCSTIQFPFSSAFFWKKERKKSVSETECSYSFSLVWCNKIRNWGTFSILMQIYYWREV